MLGNEEIKTPVKLILGALAILIIVWCADYFTGFLTSFHLRNEENLALKHGVNSELYHQMMDELIGDTRSSEYWERKAAAVELGHLGAGAARAGPVLEDLLDDKVMDVRTAAAIALARIGIHTNKAVSPLIEVLQHGSDHDKYLAVQSLGMIGAGARDAVPYLAHELTQGHVDVSRVTRTALEKIGTPEALQAIKQAGQL